MYARYIVIAVTAGVALLAACAAPAAPTAAPTKPVTAPSAAPAMATKPSAPSGSPGAEGKSSAPSGSPGAEGKPAAAATTAPATAAKIKRGGTLKMASVWTYPTLDPHLSAAMNVAGFPLLYDALLRYELVQQNPPKAEIKPELAESWTIKDPKTIVFKLRQGIKFSDGTAFNASVAKWNLERMVNHKKSYVKPQVEAIDSVQVIDDSTIQVNLKQPFAPLLTALSPGAASTYIISQATVDKLGDDAFANAPVGSGPMELVKWARDDVVEVKAKKGYWKQGADGQPLPYLDSVAHRFRPDASVMLLELRAGELQIAEDIEAKDIAAVKSSPNLNFIEHPSGGYAYFTFGMNTKNDPFAKNLKLRQALQHSVDRESMAKTLGFGNARPHYYPRWNIGQLGYDDTVVKYTYDEAKAKQLLAEAGYPSGIDITMTVINRSAEMRISEMVKSMWDKVGFRTTLENMERLAWIDKMKNMNFQTGFWRGNTLPDSGQVMQYHGCGASGNWNSWCNPEFDKCVEQGNATYDTAERDRLFKRCLRIIAEDAFVGTGYFLPYNWAMDKKVKDFTFQYNVPDLRATWLE